MPRLSMNKVFCTLGAAGLFAASMLAEEPARTVSPSQLPATEQSPPAPKPNAGISTFSKASSFLGSIVRNAEGKELGTVQDLVFDLEERQLSYAVLALAEESGSRIVSVPVRALKPVAGEKHLLLNMSESILAAAESLRDGEWPAANIFAIGSPAKSETGTARSTTKPQSSSVSDAPESN